MLVRMVVSALISNKATSLRRRRVIAREELYSIPKSHTLAELPLTVRFTPLPMI